jgi:hypothetical protein
MERRELIGWLVATAGLPSLAFGREVHRRAPPRSLSAHIERTLAAATERILPGAAAANVGAFIDKMLADWHTPEERARFLAGLPELDRRCRARAARDFVDCPEGDQVAVLTALDDEVSAAGTNDHWFARLKYLTVYGYCTSEAGMRALRLYPLPWRYDGCAPV